jgi:hypothetical protein
MVFNFQYKKDQHYFPIKLIFVKSFIISVFMVLERFPTLQIHEFSTF